MILLILSLTYTYYNPAPAAKPPVVEKKAPIAEKKAPIAEKKAAPASPFANIFGASKPAAKTAPVAKKGKILISISSLLSLHFVY